MSEGGIDHGKIRNRSGLTTVYDHVNPLSRRESSSKT